MVLLVDGSWTTICPLMTMPHVMRQSKDAQKEKGRGEREKNTPTDQPLELYLPCRNPLFQGSVNFFTPPLPQPNNQEHCCCLAAQGTALLQVDSCVWWLDEDIVFAHCVLERTVIIEAIFNHSVETAEHRNVH